MFLWLAEDACAFQRGDVISGPSRVVDGDTLEIGSVTVRLHGVAAPERNEPGGDEASAYLRELTTEREVRCRLSGKRSYKREVGTCWVGNTDLAAALISAGLARDCPRFSDGRYAALEARKNEKLPLPPYCLRR